MRARISCTINPRVSSRDISTQPMLPSVLVTGTVLTAKLISSGCMNERAKTSRYAAVHMCCHARRRSQTCSSFFLWNVQFFFVNLHTTFIHISACLNLQIMSGWDTGQTYHSDPINQVSITDQCQQYHTQKIPPPQHSSRRFGFFGGLSF